MSDETIAIGNNQIRYQSKLFMLAVLVLSIAVVTVPILIVRILLYDEDGFSKNAILTHLVLPGVWSAITLLIIILIVWTHIVGGLDLFWYRWSRSEALKAIILIIAAPLFYYSLAYLIQRLGLPVRKNLYFSAYRHGLSFYIILTILGAFLGPILEELFWRGYIQRTLERIFGGLFACVVQAVFFATYHFYSLGGFLQVFVFGLVMGTWRWRRRTLIPIILAHMVINSLLYAPQWPDWLECTKIRRSVDYAAQYKDIAGIAELNPNDNAHNLYELARQSAVAIPPEYEQIKNLWPKIWSSKQHTIMLNWLSESEKMLGYVEQGSRKPYYWPRLEEDIMASAMPELAWVSRSVFALRIRSQLYAAEGRLDSAFSDLVTCLRLADHLAGRRPIVSQLVALSIRNVAAGSAFRILKNTDVPPETLEHLQIHIEQSLANNVHTIDFAVERLIVLHEIQLMFTDDGTGNGHIPEIALRIPRTMQPLLPGFTMQQKQALMKLDRRRTTILVKKFFDLLDDAARITAWQFQNNTVNIKKELESITKQNAFISEFNIVDIRPLEIASRTRTELEGLITTLAILRYEAEKGQLPSNLEKLVDEGYLKALPQDSFSDGPLLYKQTPDSFMLYSRGLDLDDDGGVPSNWGKGEKGGDQVFWPVQESKANSQAPIETKTQ